MNEISRNILKKSGWYEGKKIDLTKIKKLYEKHQKIVFPKAEELLGEFGGLNIDYPEIPSVSLNIEGYLEAGYLDGWAKELSIVLNEEVLMIGSCLWSESRIYISESGNIYTDYGLIGHNQYDFWDCILSPFITNDKNNKLITWEELGIKEKLERAEQQLMKEEYAQVNEKK